MGMTAVRRQGSQSTQLLPDDVNTLGVAAGSEYSLDIIMIVLANDKKHAPTGAGTAGERIITSTVIP